MIDIILCTFRRPQLLKAAIQSVLEQSYPLFRLCIFDNHSEDETEEVVRSFSDSRIHYVQRPENVGLASNYVLASKTIIADYFCFVGDDDLYHKDHFKHLIELFEKHPEIGFAASGVVQVFDDCEEILQQKSGYFEKQDYSAEPVMFSTLFHKKVLEKAPALNPEAKLSFDREYLLRCMHAFPYVVSEKPTFYFNRKKQATSSHLDTRTQVNWLKDVQNATSDCIPASIFRTQASRHFFFWLQRKKYQEAEPFLEFLGPKERLLFHLLQSPVRIIIRPFIKFA